MSRIRTDIRYALRTLRRRPGFAVVAILTLGIGIGANSAIFTVVNSLLFGGPPFVEPERLVNVYRQIPDFAFAPLSHPDFEDVVAATDDVFAGLSASGLTLVQVDEAEGVGIRSAELVTANYFDVVGLEPHLGRTFAPEDDRAGAPEPVTVLAFETWQREYGADAGVVGREIRLHGRTFTVIGVAPESYDGNLKGVEPAYYLPLQFDPLLEGTTEGRLQSRGSQWLFVRGRLAEGVPVEAARVALRNVAAALREAGHVQWEGAQNGLVPVPTADVVINPTVDRFLVPGVGLVLGVVGLVLLIACANLAGVLLARAAGRRREIAVRMALGASRRALMVQLLTETMLLGLLGGLLGLAVGRGLLDLGAGLDIPLPVAPSLDVPLDLRVVGFSFAVALAAGLLFGLAPALQATRTDIATTIRTETTGAGRRRFTLRGVLVVSQVAASTVLLVVGGLMLRSLGALADVDPGFGHEPTALLSIWLPENEFTTEEARHFREEMGRRAAALPGVGRIGWIDNPPLNLLNQQGRLADFPDVPAPEGEPGHVLDYARVEPGTFEAAGIELEEGRDFVDTDDADAPRVAVLNRVAAERYFSGSAVGRTFTSQDETLRVVGVVETTKVRYLGEADRPMLYLPMLQDPSGSAVLIATTEGDARALALVLLREARKLHPRLLVTETKTMEQQIGLMLLPARATALVVGTVAVLALLLACIGLYGVVSATAAEKRREVGIRISLGATSLLVLRQVLRGGLLLVAAGGVTGMLLALGASRVLGRLLYGIDSLDLVTFVAVPLVLVLVATAATFWPAFRASRADPVRALRAD